jgi:hypothetical protein
MAVYFLRSKHISRSNGSRVTRAAAFRAGERIRHEATSEVFDFSSRRDIPYKEIVLPADLADRADMAWTQDRWLVFLPPELIPDQRHQLVHNFARGLGDRYRAARRWKEIYDGPKDADPRKNAPQRDGDDSTSPRSRQRGQDLER